MDLYQVTVSLSNGTFSVSWTSEEGITGSVVGYRNSAEADWTALPETNLMDVSHSPERVMTCDDAWEFRVRSHGAGTTFITDWSDWVRSAYQSPAIADTVGYPARLRDCNILLNAKATLAGTSTSLNWGLEHSLYQWFGTHIERGFDSDGNEMTSGGVGIILLAERRLNGSIPSSFGGLADLYQLNLRNNQLTGSIPSELGDMESLEGLYIDQNALSGPIPPEIGNISTLEEFSASRNQLSGNLPEELGKLSNLVRLDLNATDLTGSIPTEFGKLTMLESLMMTHNSLTGSVPSELGDLLLLNRLLLMENSFTGCISRN